MEELTELRKAQLVMLRLLKVINHICEQNDIQYFLISGSLLGAVRHQGFIPWDDDLDIAMMREDYDRFLEVCKEQLPDDFFLQTRQTDQYYKVYHVPCKVRHTTSLLIEEGMQSSKACQGIYIDIFPFDKHSCDARELKNDLKLWNIFIFLQRYTKKSPKSKLHGFILMIVKRIVILCLHFYFVLARRRIAYNEKHYKDRYKITPGFDLYWSLTNVFDKEDIFPLVKIRFEDGYFPIPRDYDKVLSMIYGNYMELPPIEKRTAHAIKLVADLKCTL